MTAPGQPIPPKTSKTAEGWRAVCIYTSASGKWESYMVLLFVKHLLRCVKCDPS